MKAYLLIFFFLLVSCSPSTLSEWRVEGISIVRDLVSELESIDTLSSLEDKKSVIKKKYTKLVHVMIEADKFEEEEESFFPESFYSDALRDQYLRLYQIDGAKEILFSIQKESLHKLDLYLTKKN